MSSVETIQKINTVFQWPSQEAIPLMKQSIKDDSYANAFESRMFFVIQAISSIVAIPFILIASLFIIVWKLMHCEGTEALYTLPAAAIAGARNFSIAISSLIAAISPMEWSIRNLDCFEFEPT